VTRIIWGEAGSRYYDAGVDRGVLYIAGQPGVPWNGLTAVNENPVGGSTKAYYIDGVRYLNKPASEEFGATLTAYTYPEAFEVCDGTASIRPGLLAMHQRRQPFGLTYRNMLGNDLSDNAGYKVHIIFNAMAAPTSRGHKTLTTSRSPDDFTWTLTALPNLISGYTATAHLVLDSRTMDPQVLSAIEDILYGNDEISAQLPDVATMTDLVDNGVNLTVTINGDGTFTLKAPMGDLAMLDASIFQLNSDQVVDNGDGTWTASSP
jgi:hypothetical protein